MAKKIDLAALAVIAMALVAARLLLPNYRPSVTRAQEGILRQNLLLLRTVINQYTLEMQKRPQTLDDLATAGYLKQLPADPMTGRNDTWVMERSNDPKTPGIVNIRSGSPAISSNGNAYSDW